MIPEAIKNLANDAPVVAILDTHTAPLCHSAGSDPLRQVVVHFKCHG